MPAFLKRDGTWAGEGVAEIGNRGDIEPVWRKISCAHLLPSTLRRARHTGWRYALTKTRMRRPAIQLQAAATGQPANCALLCRKGEAVAGITAVAVETTSATGPASVVRVIQHEEMTSVATALAKSLGSNGFFGVDFILSETGEAFFLEINARPTPIALLPVAGGTDLIAALFATMSDSPATAREPIARDLIALFPQEISSDANSPHLANAHHYLPADEPRLIAAARSNDQRVWREGADRASEETEAHPRFPPIGQILPS